VRDRTKISCEHIHFVAADKMYTYAQSWINEAAQTSSRPKHSFESRWHFDPYTGLRSKSRNWKKE